MEKNEIVEVSIEDMTEQGEGIGKWNGFPLFIRNAVVGDLARVRVVKVKKGYGYGKLEQVLIPSPDRTEPRCPAAGPCGGCQLQAMRYEAQLTWKRKKVGNALRRLGGFTVDDGTRSGETAEVFVKPVLGMENPWEYRNKCQVPVGKGKDGHIAMGFYAARSHQIVETAHCFLGDPVNERIQETVRKHMEAYHIAPYDEEKGTGLIRHILIRKSRSTGETMVCLVINGRKCPGADRLAEALREIPGVASVSLNINREKTNVILGKELVQLYGPGVITDTIGENRYRISPLSFYQVNPEQTEKLYRAALEAAALTGEETVWDLYCGAGTISLFLARASRQVYGVEIVPQAVENARENARLNGISNAEFYLGKAEEVLPEANAVHIRETGHPLQADVIVVDPPRKGCDAGLLSVMLAMAPQRIVYVSCDCATLARDLKILCSSGAYRIASVQPVDMFAQGVGIETVVGLIRCGE